MESIVIVGIVVLLAVGWARLVLKQNASERDDTDHGAVSGAWHPAGVEYGSRTHEIDAERGPPVPGVCLACGTENDPFYTYCHNCVQRLDPL
jgi:hypothetical protein